MQFLKQNTAVTVKIGPFIDDTDGKTAETALTITQADVRLSKNGGDIAQKNESSDCTHDELGIYNCSLDATDTNTAGRLQLWVHKSGALPVWHEYMVLPANVYDSLFGSDKLEVDIVQIGGEAQSATDLKDFADSGYDPSAHKIEGCKVNDDMRGTDNAALASVCTEARLAELDAANIPSDIDTLLSRLTATRANYLDNLSEGPVALASVCTETRLAHLDADISSRSSHSAADVWAVGTRSLTDKAGFSLSAEGIDAIWDELMSGHTIQGSFGERLQPVRSETAQGGGTNTITLDAGASAVDDYYVNQTIFLVGGTGAGQSRKISSYVGSTKVATVDSNWATQPDNTTKFIILPDYILTGTGASASEVWSYATRSLTDKDGFGLADNAITAAKIATDAITADKIAANAIGASEFAQAAADKVWASATRALTDKADFALSDAGIQAIWDALTSNLTTAGSIGKLLVDNIDAAISSRSSHSAADVWSVDTRSLTDKAGFSLSDAGVDDIFEEVVEDSTTFRQMLRIIFAALAGKSSGGGTTTVRFRDIADTKDRITATVDSDGNRTAITLDGT